MDLVGEAALAEKNYQYLLAIMDLVEKAAVAEKKY